MTTHRNSAPAHARSLPVRQLVLTLLGWSIALIIFFPILWMVLTGFKTETAAIADPSFLFSPTGGSILVESIHSSVPLVRLVGKKAMA